MIRYFKTDNQRIQEEEKIGDGVWVQMLQPTHQECAEIAEVLNVDIEDIQAALDEEAKFRIKKTLTAFSELCECPKTKGEF